MEFRNRGSLRVPPEIVMRTEEKSGGLFRSAATTTRVVRISHLREDAVAVFRAPATYPFASAYLTGTLDHAGERAAT